MSGAMLHTSLIQFSDDGWGCIPSLLFDLRPNYGGGNENNGDLLQKVPCRHRCTQCPQHCKATADPHLHQRFLTLTGKSELVSSGVTVHFFCVLVHTGSFFWTSKNLFPQSCTSSGGSVVGLVATFSKRAYAIPRSAAPGAPAPVAVLC